MAQLVETTQHVVINLTGPEDPVAVRLDSGLTQLAELLGGLMKVELPDSSYFQVLLTSPGSTGIRIEASDSGIAVQFGYEKDTFGGTRFSLADERKLEQLGVEQPEKWNSRCWTIVESAEWGPPRVTALVDTLVTVTREVAGFRRDVMWSMTSEVVDVDPENIIYTGSPG